MKVQVEVHSPQKSITLFMEKLRNVKVPEGVAILEGSLVPTSGGTSGVRGSVLMAVYSAPGGGQRLAGCQTLEGSFSAVWTATIARKDAFCRDFRDLQDLHSFAPL